jgi:hypothetical protein
LKKWNENARFDAGKAFFDSDRAERPRNIALCKVNAVVFRNNNFLLCKVSFLGIAHIL